jgi:hypothetical protein
MLEAQRSRRWSTPSDLAQQKHIIPKFLSNVSSIGEAFNSRTAARLMRHGETREQMTGIATHITACVCLRVRRGRKLV